MLHFAYGSNMSRELMRMRCKGARALGTAMLLQWRFGLNSDGLASVSPHRGQRVHGVLWRLTLRDLSALNAYESIDCGLYRPRLLPVHSNNGTRTALVYIGRQSNRAKPRPDHIQTVLQAAREWGLPEP